ncbi:MAG: beta-phosphoglucomutase family hydrolase [Bacteroidales bacterium]|nr:beta-phosphoglucomutase family hydrolase [Bacteroidales bacterium]
MVQFEAVIFDLDGVITKTALVHGAAWKRMFDEFLRSREERFGESFREFTHNDDYLPYVDGKPRYKGVESFLESRGIKIPFGDPSDDPDAETVCGLGNKKNLMFNKVLDDTGVSVYDSTVRLIEELKSAGVRIGVASSSKNCKPVLEKAGLLDYFETRIDGVVSAEIGLKGKPEADIFTTACDRLGVSYHKSVVVEDAVSGVQAGRNGNFGLVIGVAREDNLNELRINGGDIVVEDMSEIDIDLINRWFETRMEEESWHLRYFDYNHENERSRETLLAIGNGYFGTRGAAEESRANKVNYPGTYISGLYNRRISKVADRKIENEDFVNIPNWLPLKFKINDGEWFEFNRDPSYKLLEIKRDLNLRTGELKREIVVEDKLGRKTEIVSSRFAGMHYHHIAAIKYIIKPLNYTAAITIRSEIDGNHINAGIERYKDLDQHHLTHIKEKVDGNYCMIEVRTTESNVTIAMGAKHIINGNEDLDEFMDCTCSRGKACQDFTLTGSEGDEIVFEKLVSIYTSQDKRVIIPRKHARAAIDKMTDYDGELDLSSRAWAEIWERIDVKIGGDRQAGKLVHLHLYHTMVTSSPHHINLDAGIPPRGLHGEAYRGHIFWDELYILPLYNIHFPDIAKSVLMYRYRRLSKARDYAREHGYMGAMFPWQSGSDGREETQVVHLNPLSGEWGDDYSSLQRHISLAIAYNICTYYHISGDSVFMAKYGAEVLFDICRFWVSKCRFDEKENRFHIDRVMGPDEFHEKLPGAETGGLTDNAYTNIMVSWMLGRAINYLESIPEDKRKPVRKRLKLKREDIENWNLIRKRLLLNISGDGIIEQFKGYFDLEELNWDGYREKYGDIHRLDRILKAEGKSPDEFKLSKQADLLMTFFNLGEKEITRLLKEMGYKVPDDYYRQNFKYYEERTSHGSTLSMLVYSNIAYRLGDHEKGWEMFMEALRSDMVDIQGGTTGEGIHCGVMAGTVYSVISLFAGLDLSGEIPGICPALPDHWTGLSFRFRFRGIDYIVKIDRDSIKIKVLISADEKIKLHICGNEFEISGDTEFEYNLKNQ